MTTKIWKNLLNLILEEYKDLKDKKITEKELQKAKDYLKGTTSLSLDSSDSQASFYGAAGVIGKKYFNARRKI